MLPLDDEGVAYALVALRKISRKSESTNFFQENPGIFLFFKKLALSLHPKICSFVVYHNESIQSSKPHHSRES